MNLNQKNNSIRIFVEVSKTIGLGHFSRMQKLASRLKSQIHWVVVGDTSLIPKDFLNKGQVEVLESSSKIIECISNFHSTVIIDIYHANLELHKEIRKRFLGKLIYFGFNQIINEPNTFIINLAEGRGPFPASHDNSNLLEGWKYFITSEEIVRPKFRIKNQLQNVLMVFGGTNAGGLAEMSFDFLQNTKTEVHFHLIVPDSETRSRLVYSNSNKKLTIISPKTDLIPFLKKFDLVLTSPGNIYFETFLQGIPFIAVCQSESQELQFDGFPLIFSKAELKTILLDINHYYELSKRFLLNYNNLLPGEGMKEILEIINN